MNERGETAGITLTTMLEERIRQLPEGSRDAAQCAGGRGPAGEPGSRVQRRAALASRFQILNAVRAAQFVRSGGTAMAIELHHDRIGETLRALLPDA